MRSIRRTLLVWLLLSLAAVAVPFLAALGYRIRVEEAGASTKLAARTMARRSNTPMLIFRRNMVTLSHLNGERPRDIEE